VEAKRSKGDERDLAAAVDKYTKMKKSEKASSRVGGGMFARGGPRNRAGYNTVRTPAPASFPIFRPCRRRRRHARRATSRGRRRGRELVSNVWRQGIGGEMPSVRRRISLELVFYCVEIHCGIV
jgi:hypothetical protein